MGEILFETQKLTKAFPGVKALSNVDLTIKAGEVVGLVGENGAGKSTLLNIMSGLFEQDSGKMFLRGQEFLPEDYHSASKQGVARVFQELALVPNMTVYENLFLSHEDLFSKFGVLNKKQMIAKAREILAKLHLDIDPTKPIDHYNFSIKQGIEIAKACSISSELFNISVPLILLDEPTTSLTREEMEDFFALIRKQKARASFVFISHRLSEILQISDRIYVMKDGAVVDVVLPSQVDERKLHELMVGRKRDEDYYKEDAQLSEFGKTVLSVSKLSKKDLFEDVSLEVCAGEIVGIGGVIGSGKAELGKVLAGAIPIDSGTIEIDEIDLTKHDIMERIAKGLGYIPEERKLEGIIDNFSINWNTSLASIRDMISNKLGLLNLKQEKETALNFMQKLAIKAQHEKIECGTLSGGNQQKVVLAKWLMRDLKILIVDNPTRGIDPGAKEEIYKLFRELAREGLGIVLITDELLELIGMANRILIMKDGKISTQLEAGYGAKPTELQLVGSMV